MSKSAPLTDAAKQPLNTSFLEGLMGYNARRASLVIIAQFLQRMAEFELRPVDFSVLTLIAHNAGITSRQLCTALNILPPNLVGILNSIEKRGLITRQPHPSDGRAVGLHLTAEGAQMATQAQQAAQDLEAAATPRLSTAERKTLMRLLQKIYL